MHTAQDEISDKRRFAFGANWKQFLSSIDEQRIALAVESLRQMLVVDDLSGKTFLDVGCGSGLFSLAATRLGASVVSFDFDQQSVACAETLRTRYALSADWTVLEGSVLDEQHLSDLGTFDVVYSWGVLHHTGDMWQALSNVVRLVNSQGKLALALYNDQGRSSDIWLGIKRLYNFVPSWIKPIVIGLCCTRLWGPTTVRDLFRGKPFFTWRQYSKLSVRGMSPWHDLVDWVGGLPFEVAKPEAVFEFFKRRGFQLEVLRTCAGGHGCNEFMFSVGPQ